MPNEEALPGLLKEISLAGILRVDAGLEGDWSGSVTTIWSPGTALVVDGVMRSHPHHKPSLELYFDGSWVGLHCFSRVDGTNRFDEDLARRVVSFIENAISSEY